jgi:CSLREA domain-containing protein
MSTRTANRPSGAERRSRCVAEALERRALLAAIVVNSAADDATPGDGMVTLREAITAANDDTTTDTGQTGSGADTITFALGLGAHSISLSAGALPALYTSVDIRGAGAAVLTVRHGGTETRRVFLIERGGDVRLSGMTIADGTLSGIVNRATLAVVDCTLRDNTASTYSSGFVGGGAIHNSRDLVVQRCTIRDNEAFGAGGGITNATGGTLLVLDSTFYGNRVSGSVGLPGVYGRGGGISNGGTLRVSNSTFSNNTAHYAGGAIYTSQTATIEHSTLTGNRAGGGGGGGIRTSGTLTLTLNSSVVALNPTGGGMSGAFTGTHNWLTGNPMVAELFDYGGPTPTLVPLTGSPLIDAGNPDFTSPPDHDQRGRGFARVSGGRLDIGAVEVDAVAPVVQTAQFHFLTAPQSMRYTFSENVAATLDADDLSLENLAAGTAIPAANLALAYDASTNTARFTFPGYAFGALPDGRYRATLRAAGVADPSGNPLDGDEERSFFFLNGDANRDGRVNLADFNILATNFGRAGTDFTDGDFTYDGTTDLADFDVLAGRFGSSLPGATAGGAGERGSPRAAPDGGDDWLATMLR